MSHAIETFQVGELTVKIIPDDESRDCPLGEAYDDKGAGLEKEGIIFASFEKRSTLSNYHSFTDPADAVAFAKKNRWDIFDLQKYEHSGVAYSISKGYPFNDRWDAGQVGYILIKRSAFRGEKRRQEVAESWCKAITTWCNGWYYGFVVEDSDGEHIDSCWGFDDFEYCKKEATGIAEHENEKRADDMKEAQEVARENMLSLPQ